LKVESKELTENIFSMTANNLALQGTTALVTGATSPLGRAIALGLAQEGADIVVHFCTSAQKARVLCGEIEKSGCSAYPVRADFSRESEYSRLIRQAKKRFGRLDILVNNASLYTRSTLNNLAYPDFITALRVNAWAPFVLCREFKMAAGRGAIVNLLDSRIVGYDREHAGYSLSKHALDIFTRMMAIEFAPGIRVNAVAPGLILTRAGEKERYNRLSRTLPLQRYGEPEDVAQAVLFLVKSPFITGQIVYVDGGRMAREKESAD
jgi:pteridine reductase